MPYQLLNILIATAIGIGILVEGNKTQSTWKLNIQQTCSLSQREMNSLTDNHLDENTACTRINSRWINKLNTKIKILRD